MIVAALGYAGAFWLLVLFGGLFGGMYVSQQRANRRPSPRCPECGREMMYDPNRGWQCDSMAHMADEC